MSSGTKAGTLSFLAIQASHGNGTKIKYENEEGAEIEKKDPRSANPSFYAAMQPFATAAVDLLGMPEHWKQNLKCIGIKRKQKKGGDAPHTFEIECVKHFTEPNILVHTFKVGWVGFAQLRTIDGLDAALRLQHEVESFLDGETAGLPDMFDDDDPEEWVVLTEDLDPEDEALQEGSALDLVRKKRGRGGWVVAHPETGKEITVKPSQGELRSNETKTNQDDGEES